MHLHIADMKQIGNHRDKEKYKTFFQLKLLKPFLIYYFQLSRLVDVSLEIFINGKDLL